MSYLTINREYSSQLSKDEIIDLLDQCTKSTKVGKFYCKKRKDNLYKVSARFSVGTLNFSGGFGGLAINALVDLSNADNGKLHIRTNVRVEHYFLGIVLLIMLYSNIAAGGFAALHLLGVFGIMAITHFWFHFVYRVQENMLIRKVVELLGLRESFG